jgi:hypothetical protein
MRVFAKDVTGQKLVHGFESRPLRLQAFLGRQPPAGAAAAEATANVRPLSLPFSLPPKPRPT